jgi:hypothetical protein
MARASGVLVGGQIIVIGVRFVVLYEFLFFVVLRLRLQGACCQIRSEITQEARDECFKT